MFITGEMKKDTVAFADFENYEDQIVTVKGTIHNIRMMSDFAFVILRTARETMPCQHCTQIVLQDEKSTETGPKHLRLKM